MNPKVLAVHFRGVRGSIPTPEASHRIVGGNTACVELASPCGESILIDAGTGIRSAGQALSARVADGGSHVVHIFFSHFHWDHIQGLTAFQPLFDERFDLRFYHLSPAGKSEEVIHRLFCSPYFPVPLDQARARKRFIQLPESGVCAGGAYVRPFPLFHPQGSCGFRMNVEGRTVVYASDSEHGIACHDDGLRRMADGADLLIYDAQYTPSEYRERRGWGHSTWEEGARVATDCGVKRLALFHHDPEHDDAAMMRIVSEAQHLFAPTFAAAEGKAIEC